MHNLRVNETKLTSETAFVIDLFALEGEKESKCYKRTLFWGSPQSLYLSLNPYRPKDAYMRFSGPL